MTSLNHIDSIVRPSLHEELTDRLRSMVIEGVLVPGEKVPERALCEKLGVSRTPMREALKVLAAEGLLHLEPNKGARVRAITIEDLEEVFPVMGALEALAGELACTNISDSQLTELKTAHETMLIHYHNSDMPNYFKQNEQIHKIIFNATDNATLLSMYRSLSVRLRSARYLANMTPDRWKQAVAEHEEMIVALDNRDSKELGSILKRHLQNKFATVKSWVESQSSTR
ncbi:MAG: DNA-binding GntR family transcriptional regulator [Gammaproteobacteria bacterium]